MFDIRPVAFVVGAFICTLAPLLLICAVVDLAADNPDWMVFVGSAMVTFAFGSLLTLATRAENLEFDIRQGFLLTIAVWVAICLVGAIPFYFAAAKPSIADAVFESTSGITSTGATVLSDLDHMPPGILMWRALLQWIGGLGIVATALLIFPFLQVSGMQLFKLESSDVGEKLSPRIADTTRQITLLYVALTVLTTVALIAAGLRPFDAVCHAMTGVATGGFATHDSSIGYFGNRAVEAILLVAMIAGSLTLTLVLRAVAGRPGALLRDPQTRLFFVSIGVAVVTITTWRILTSEVEPLQALWGTLFSVVAIMTTTGFVLEDHATWGALPVAAFFVIIFMGGCTGSTAGGLKAYRLYVLLVATAYHFRMLLHPHRVTALRYGEMRLDDEVVRSVMTFVLLYMASFVVIAGGLSATGLDFLTSLSGAAQAIANVGPGLGDIIGPAGNFSTLSDAAKWIISAGMLLGRLEIIAVVMVFTPAFWRV